MHDQRFQYQPLCSYPGCGRPAEFKVAASWSDGTSQELKNYGLACAQHRAQQLARARSHREGLTLADGETLGPIGLYQLKAGARDRELSRMPDERM
jgi:hypothetical protein